MKFSSLFNKSKNTNKVVITTETTGFSPEEGHKLVEIAAIEIDKNYNPTGAVFHAYINPERDISKEVVAVHGLARDFLKDYPPFNAYKNNFLHFIKGKELIGHHLVYDMNFINHELGFTLPNKVTDTLDVAKKAFPQQKNSLSSLCERLNVEIKNSPYNGALLDTLMMLEVYKKLKIISVK